MLWHVQMNRRQKSTIIGILGLGVFATAAAFVKLGYIPNYGKTGDWLWDSRNITIWTVVECNTGIIAGNLPCLKPLFRRVLGSTYGRGSRKTTSKNISRTYGAGTGHHISAKKNGFNSLSSSKARDIEDRPNKEQSFVMTTIGADSKRSPSSTDKDRDPDSPGKNSEESIMSSNEISSSPWPLGGIMRTTEVSHEFDAPKSSGRDGPERRVDHIV